VSSKKSTTRFLIEIIATIETTDDFAHHRAGKKPRKEVTEEAISEKLILRPFSASFSQQMISLSFL